MTPSFPTIEQAMGHIVAMGHPLQMPYVYRKFRNCYKVALSTVCARAPTEQTDNQALICSSLMVILQKEQLSIQELELVFNMCVQGMNNLHSPVNEDFSAVLQTVLKQHPDLVKKLQYTALELGRPIQPIISKVTSGRFISILAKYQPLKGDMVDIVKRILADNEVEAKKVWVREIFPKLLHNLELEFIELHLQQKIYQSVYDENQEVGILALSVILNNVTKFSIEEQSSRIVKLFIDSLTSKNQKISLLATESMGKVYQKLQNVILSTEANVVKFWRSIIQLAHSKNQRILQNLIYNLPGLLSLANLSYNVAPMCEIYLSLFYQVTANKLLLCSYFHQIVVLFPQYSLQLKQVIYEMFQQIFEDEEPASESIKIINKIISHLQIIKKIFFKVKQNTIEANQSFQIVFCEYLIKYYNMLLLKKNSQHLLLFYNVVQKVHQCFPSDFIEQSLLPKLYFSLKNKTPCIEKVIQIILSFLSRDVSIVNTYTSKINIEMSKSNRSFQRQSALLFFYHASFHFSIDLFQQYRLGEKFLHFNGDKCFKIKVLFIKCLSRIVYFLNREEKIEYNLILGRIQQCEDQFIQKLVSKTSFGENEEIRQKISAQSKILREKQKQKTNLLQNQRRLINRRTIQDVAKDQMLKKRIQTKSKTKVVIKEVLRRKTINHNTFGKINNNCITLGSTNLIPSSLIISNKNNSNINIKKHT